MGELRTILGRCGKCGSKIRVKTHSMEKTLPCPKCSSPVTVSTAKSVPPAKPALFSFSCPNCGSNLRAKHSTIGKAARCARCEQTIKVPQSAEVVTAPSAADSLTQSATIGQASANRRHPLPGRTNAIPDIPTLIQAYGILYMYLFGAIGITNAIAVLLWSFLLLLNGNILSICFILFLGALQSLFYNVLFRFGRALKDGKRQAVYGLLVITVLVFAVAIIILAAAMSSDNTADRAYILTAVGALIVAGILFVPPIVVSIIYWDRLS